MTSEKKITKLIEGAGGTVEEMARLPDGSGFAIASFALPKDHWIYGNAHVPPMPFRMGKNDPRRDEFARQVKEAARYAAKAATMSGKDMDFDPDALVQNMVIGMFGYYTEDGLSHLDDWSNPKPIPPIWKGKP